MEQVAMDEEAVMTTIDSVRHELTSRLSELHLTKSHLSVRFEPAPRIVRLGACIDPYNWDTRQAVLTQIIEFEGDHLDDFALEFDIVPLPAITDPTHAEA